MPLYNFFRNLFGFSEQNHGNNDKSGNNFRNQFLNPENDHLEEDLWRPKHDEPDSGDISKFNIFTDPIEMHRYFEQQLNEILKSFGMFDHDGTSVFGFNDNMPALGPSQELDLPQTNIRDHLLKPGYHSSKEDSTTDSDLDGKVNASDLDNLLKSRSSNDESLLQKKEFVIPQVRSFGQSITSQTVRRPDGSMETHRTVRDNAGNEESTVTRQMGDKQYTVTIRTDKHGTQEKIEDMINIDEQELSRFTDKWKHSETPQKETDVDWNNWFDKLFN